MLLFKVTNTKKEQYTNQIQMVSVHKQNINTFKLWCYKLYVKYNKWLQMNSISFIFINACLCITQPTE